MVQRSMQVVVGSAGGPVVTATVTVDSILGKLSLWCMQNHEKLSFDLMSKPCVNMHEHDKTCINSSKPCKTVVLIFMCE